MKKLHLSKKQQNDKRLRLQQEQAAERSAQKLKDKWEKVPTFSSRLPMPVKATASQLQPMPKNLRERLAEARATPSLVTTESLTGKSLPPRYEGELAEREIQARKKQHVAAPISNKGGMQLITNPDDFKTMGRKV